MGWILRSWVGLLDLHYERMRGFEADGSGRLALRLTLRVMAECVGRYLDEGVRGHAMWGAKTKRGMREGILVMHS